MAKPDAETFEGIAVNQSRGSGSGSEAIARCSRRFTHPVRVTPIGFFRSTSLSTLGSIRTKAGEALRGSRLSAVVIR